MASSWYEFKRGIKKIWNNIVLTKAERAEALIKEHDKYIQEQERKQEDIGIMMEYQKKDFAKMAKRARTRTPAVLNRFSAKHASLNRLNAGFTERLKVLRANLMNLMNFATMKKETEMLQDSSELMENVIPLQQSYYNEASTSSQVSTSFDVVETDRITLNELNRMGDEEVIEASEASSSNSVRFVENKFSEETKALAEELGIDLTS